MERAILVTIEEEGKKGWRIEDREAELRRLAESCQVSPVAAVSCKRRTLNPAFF